MYKIKSLVDFSRVPKGTIGTIERDGDLWKVTWDNLPHVFRGMPFKKRPLQDWFSQQEFDQYLVKI